MDPQDQRPKRPTLFVGDTEPTGHRNRILADIAGTTAKPARPAKTRRFGLIAVGLVLFATAALLWLSRDEPERSPVVAATTDAPVASGARSSADTEDHDTDTGGAAIDGAANQATAMIVSDAPAHPAAPAAPATVAATPAQRQAAIELDKVFAPPSPAPVVATATERRPTSGKATRRDDDVDLLTALMRHLDSRPKAPPVSGAAAAPAVQLTDAERIERRLKVCPAANTVAGVNCRQRICAGHLGESPSCPAPKKAD